MTPRLPGPMRRQQILDVAMEMFGVGGFDSASMAAIARSAGITKPVVYQHFESKRSLFLEVLADCGHRLVACIEKATADAAGPHEQVTRGFTAFVIFFRDHPAAFRVLFSEASRSDPDFAAQVARVETVIAELVAAMLTDETLDTADRLVLAHGIVGLAEGACRRWIDTGEPADPERVATLLATLTWGGLRSRFE